MPAPSDFSRRLFLLVRKRPGFLQRYRLPNETLARRRVAEALNAAIPTIATQTAGFKIVSLPSRPSVMMDNGNHPIIAGIDELVVTLLVKPADLRFFLDIPSIAPADTVTSAGIDAPIRVNGYWAGGIGMGNMFSTRDRADNLIGRSELIKNAVPLTGQGVHVALMDSGLDMVERQQLGLNFGLSVSFPEHVNSLAGAPPAPRYGHAFTMARNFKAIAPDVTIHDYAILPVRLSKALIPSMGVRVGSFLSDAAAAYIALASHINWRRNLGDNNPWVVVNSWAVYERTWDPKDPIDDPDPDVITHPLNAKIALVASLGVDIIFCAGNGGQFGNDPRCGHDDKGPGRSIIGPNGHPDVITVGSVRTDGGWIGSSSQGPGAMNAYAGNSGRPLEAIQKPDLAAPSDFVENWDNSQLNTGTSTACALTAATIAALRQGWPTLSRVTFKQALISSARQLETAGWNNRTGHGILNIDALTTALGP